MDEEESVYPLHTICRICLSLLQEDGIYDLFIVPGLAEKLSNCTTLSVEPLDGFPNNLCSSCFERLNDMQEFQQMCIDSVQRFRAMLDNNLFPAFINHDINQIDNVDVLAAGEEAKEEITESDPLLNTKAVVVEDVFEMLSVSNDESSQEDPPVQSALENHSDEVLPIQGRITTRSLKAKIQFNAVDEESNYDYSSSSETIDAKNKYIVKPKGKHTPIKEGARHNLIECHICQQKFKSPLRYEDHMKHHNELLPFQCTVETCGKGFTTSGGLRFHMDHSHPETSQMIPCTFEGCDKTFPKTVLLTFHMKKVHNLAKAVIKRHPCPECDKVFVCPSALKKHMFKHTGEELPFACEICGKRFPIYTVLRDHLLRHAGIKNHVCPYCGVGKTTRQEWNKHILTHTKEKQYQCTQCDHASHNKQALTNHINVVHKHIRKFACQYCGKCFGKSHAWKIHERVHTGDNCPECKICGRKFLTEKSLTKHLQSHEQREIPSQGDQRLDYNCSEDPLDIQPKATRVEVADKHPPPGLNEVNPISTVSVPAWLEESTSSTKFEKKDGQHFCPGCGRGFNQLANMKLHYRVVHEKIKDFACRFCPKRFARAQYLRSHEYIHTGEKPYKCKICGKCFRQDNILSTHMRVHQSSPTPSRKMRRKAADERTKVTKRQTRNRAEYQDPAAERAAASAALYAQQMEESQAKIRQEETNRTIKEAAHEQLCKLQHQIRSEKASYDSYYEQKVGAKGTYVS